MFIDKPTCNLKYCRFFSDYNCMAEKTRHERCPYKIMRDDVDALGYINVTGHLEKRLWPTKFKPGDEVFVRDDINSKWKKAILLNYEPARVYQYYTYKIDDKIPSYNKFITKEVPDEES